VLFDEFFGFFYLVFGCVLCYGGYMIDLFLYDYGLCVMLEFDVLMDVEYCCYLLVFVCVVCVVFVDDDSDSSFLNCGLRGFDYFWVYCVGFGGLY